MDGAVEDEVLAVGVEGRHGRVVAHLLTDDPVGKKDRLIILLWGQLQ